ncbi:twin-arginine translocase TatA/TatE family subunit [Rubripirellula amarantea]|uniref:Sec-independent protein translocase protein TatA n=1 Tax=Rubripirellula amarantea TaxID=2527999 RepID=A0A5C5WJI9_9BACT|nr:twin-arginine translocase TatA/TatE family subunit [Rubripirellula amarantea]MDA8743967.1 twin-arginine translocase TatA/TatE family subunit [Rubripirellula amarantea]TWT50285.1 twin arginine translocase protein A [Rubripirellula amarantea]
MLFESIPTVLGFGNLLGFGAPGPLELAIIAGIILLLFGSSKLPTLMRNLGRSTNEFKRGMTESTLDDDSSKSDSSDKSA